MPLNFCYTIVQKSQIKNDQKFKSRGPALIESDGLNFFLRNKGKYQKKAALKNWTQKIRSQRSLNLSFRPRQDKWHRAFLTFRVCVLFFFGGGGSKPRKSLDTENCGMHITAWEIILLLWKSLTKRRPNLLWRRFSSWNQHKREKYTVGQKCRRWVFKSWKQ